MQMELKNGGGKLMEINLNLKFEGKKRYRRSFRREPALTHYDAEILDAFTFGYKDIPEERLEEYMRAI